MEVVEKVKVLCFFMFYKWAVKHVDDFVCEANGFANVESRGIMREFLISYILYSWTKGCSSADSSMRSPIKLDVDVD
jgi:hypothetical protein